LTRSRFFFSLLFLSPRTYRVRDAHVHSHAVDLFDDALAVGRSGFVLFFLEQKKKKRVSFVFFLSIRALVALFLSTPDV